MDQPAEPVPSPTRAATPLLPDQKAVNASRNEILFIATGVLILVVQLVLVIWYCAPRAFAPKPTEQRAVTWEPRDSTEAVVSNDEDEDAERPNHRRHNHNQFRRSSTWNGRARATGADDHVRRRKSSGVKPAIILYSSEPEESDSSFFGDHSLRQGLRYNGLMAASLAIPMAPASPRRIRSPRSSPKCESDDSNDAGSEREMHLMPPTDAAMPPTLSPRSPRLGPIDKATKAILKEERRKSEENKRRKSETMVPPESPPIVDEKHMANGFDDPLGVNRSKTLFGDEFERSILEESRTRPNEMPLAGENGAPIDGQLRRRPTSR